LLLIPSDHDVLRHVVHIQTSQVHYKSLVDMLRLVCGNYFSTSLSTHMLELALGLQQPQYHRYIVCPNTSCRQLYDWCPSCSRTWRYVASPPACPCLRSASDELDREAKRGADHEQDPGLRADPESEAERRDRLGHVCLHVRYPRHSRADGSLPCGTLLFKPRSRGHVVDVVADASSERTAASAHDRDDVVEEKKGAAAAAAGAAAAAAAAAAGGKKRAVRVPEPCLVYCYRPLPQRLAQILCRPGVEDQLEEWRSRLASTPPGVMTDVYHGRM
jgi:hypothetical protein